MCGVAEVAPGLLLLRIDVDKMIGCHDARTLIEKKSAEDIYVR
jgi:hypothetical protein